MQPIIDTETYWEQKLPSEYERLIERSEDRLQWETKKDLYSIFCKGFILTYGEEWFYLGKDGKQCLMVPTKMAVEGDRDGRWKWIPEPETRFGKVAESIFDTFSIFCNFNTILLSPQTTFALYFVYKLPDDYERVDHPVQVVDKDADAD